MRIGLDFHGVCDLYPIDIANMAENLKDAGHEIIIITGQEEEKIVQKILALPKLIKYDKIFSIVDYHKSIKTKMWQDDKKTWWMDSYEWIITKGDFCEREKINIHFDDSVDYAKFMPCFTTFVLVPKIGFESVIRRFRHF